MEKQLKKNKRELFNKSSNKTVTNEVHINLGSHLKQDQRPKMGSGACTVPGCGCPSFKDSGGTCWNLNSAGGTCNHLASDHE